MLRLSHVAATGVIAAAFVLAACDQPHKFTRQGVILVDHAEAQQLVDQKSGLLGLGSPVGVWLDPRDPTEFARGHIPGAINIPLEEIRGRMERLGGVSTIVVQGDDANDIRAEAAARRLIDIGFTRVRLLEGGLQAWTAAGHELETGP